MAATPKLSPAEWGRARVVWESDPREGFAWLPAQLCLPVSRESVRKKALAEKWKKHPESFGSLANSGNGGMVAGMVALTGSGNLAQTMEAMNAEEARPFKSRETPVLDELDKSEPRQGRFVREYVIDLNGTQAAIRAGYSVDSARTQASDLLAKPNIQAAVCELRDETLRKLEANVEELVRYWLDILRADPNAITTYRRQCCPYCHGTVAEDGHRRAKQYTPAQYDVEKRKHDLLRAKTLEQSDQMVDIGEFPSYEGDWYSRHRKPNPKCPECEGEGIGEHFISDTRNLPAGVAALFNGVKKTKEGIEVLMSSKEKAADQLGRFLGAFKDRDINVKVTMPTVDALKSSFEARMKQADERQRRVLEERGTQIDGDFEREG